MVRSRCPDDVEFPEAVRTCALNGAALVLVPTANFHPYSFANDPTTNMWHYYGEGISEPVGEQWEAVVSKCSLNRLRRSVFRFDVGHSSIGIGADWS